MKSLTLQPINKTISVKTDTKVLDTLLASQCEVAMACGGMGLCATCHVFVIRGEEALTPRTEREIRTLGTITGATARSRLSCQARVIGDGVVVELPEGMYLQDIEDLRVLVGKRAEIPIMHPRDGRVLIERGKIITKSRILELEGEDFDMTKLAASAS
ncbi:MAG: 2Fe-2S iron-sulfur cluster-binding protein [Chloracidobacterium sp.]|uniref:2Fe-2S iron-sulfur cluster binding domain-containing protein n=1 Tax=Chloracidobacterium validum TaxID=2821543 RepID=A0ABX8BCE7_9BACT|nr:2Fe-2S iron-sulfur cluster-binding protein [Chloracidobacterium validum]QUW03696.1 2Fe-2S iron-sulfur cluster binding domain-containing protein [Chloracidobacterium validum]